MGEINNINPEDNEYLDSIRDGYAKAQLFNTSKEATKQNRNGFIETGLIGLDGVCGGNGVPRGQLIEIFGEEDSGKSSLALHLVKSVQSGDGVAVYIDLEGKLEPGFASNIGVNVDELLISEPDNAEDVFGLCEVLALGGGVDLVVIDSITALLPRAQAGAGYDLAAVDSEYQLQVEVILSGMRKLEGVAKQTGCGIILINQIRGDFDANTASSHSSTGGRSIKFRAGLRLQLFRSGYVTKNSECLGLNIKVLIVKNMTRIENKSLWLVLYFDSGFSVLEGFILNALECRVFTKHDETLYYNSTCLGRSRNEVCSYLNSNPALYCEILDVMKREV